jgi:glycosyltransferase 2 family protein
MSGKDAEIQSEAPRLKRGRLQTALSFGIAVVGLIYVAFNLNFREVWAGIRASDFRWYLLGFALFYMSLPLRAWRWQVLLANAGDRLPLGHIIRTIFRAWFVNCALPGRGGDLYSAYLLRQEAGLSLVRTGGTIFTARMLDLITLIALLAWIFLAGFRDRLPAVFGNIVYSGLGLVVLLVLGLIALGLFRERIAKRLPERFAIYLENFSHGLFRSMGKLPLLLMATLLLWVLEAARLWCVLAAVGALVEPLRVAFLALAAAIVTTLPLSPGGLGTVEALFAELFPRMGIAATLSGSAIFLDRFINYWFILLAGLVYFLLTRGRK